MLTLSTQTPELIKINVYICRSIYKMKKKSEKFKPGDKRKVISGIDMQLEHYEDRFSNKIMFMIACYWYSSRILYFQIMYALITFEHKI